MRRRPRRHHVGFRAYRDVFVRGADAGTYWTARNGSNWSAYTAMGGPQSGPVSAVTWAAGRLDIFARGRDSNQLMHQWVINGNWQPTWESLCTSCAPIAGGLVSDSWGPNRIDAVYYGSDGHWYHPCWNTTSWIHEVW